MPGRPADPLHYGIMIPPEIKEDELKIEQSKRGSGKTTSESSQDRKQDRGREDSGSNPSAE